MNEHGNIGNQNAVKPEAEKATSFLQGRCKSSDKAMWVKQAQLRGMKLMPWVIQTLNLATGENAYAKSFMVHIHDNDIEQKDIDALVKHFSDALGAKFLDPTQYDKKLEIAVKPGVSLFWMRALARVAPITDITVEVSG